MTAAADQAPADSRGRLLQWILRFAVIGMGIWVFKQALFTFFLYFSGYLTGRDGFLNFSYLAVSACGLLLEIGCAVWFRRRRRTHDLVYFFILGNAALMIACYAMIFLIYGNFFTILLLPGFMLLVTLGAILTDRRGALVISVAVAAGYLALVLVETRLGVLEHIPAGFLVGAALFLPLNAVLVGHLAALLVEKEAEVVAQNHRLSADRQALLELARSVDPAPAAPELLRLLVQAVGALVPDTSIFVAGQVAGGAPQIVARSVPNATPPAGWEKLDGAICTDSLLVVPMALAEDAPGAVILQPLDKRRRPFTAEEQRLVEAASAPIAVALRSLLMAAEIERRDRLKEIFGRYVAAQLLERILADPERIRLGGSAQKITILFADIRGFTSMSETMSPDAIVELLNEYFAAVTDCITAHDGMLDKYIGDGIMALFGVPFAGPDDAIKAVRAASQMQRRVAALNEKLARQSRAALGIGIGLNTGVVTVGNIGCSLRMDYTAIGDPVNIAARLEGKALAGQILLSESCYQEVSAQVEVEAMEPLALKGKKQPVGAYRLMGLLA